MAVYVDRMRIPFGRMLMCHMLADTQVELVAMARAIDPRLVRHYQTRPVPHYDICQAHRARALDLGALDIDRRATARIVRRLKADPQGFHQTIPETGGSR